MRIAVAGNPNAGRGADGLDEIAAAWSGRGDVEVVEAGSKDELVARTAAAAADVVVVVGGDGTFSDVVNALEPRLGSVSLALVPAGTGNDLARTLGLALDLDPAAAARAAAAGMERTIDLWEARSPAVRRLFVNACMGGLPVDVDEAVHPNLKRLVGPLAFWIAGARVGRKLPRSTVTANGRTVADCVAVGVGNGRTCGGGLQIWPDASLDDGMLGCAALPARSRAAALRLALEVRRGGHEDLPGVVAFSSERVEIDSDPEIEFNVDGELVGLTTPVTFARAGSVRMWVPGDRAPHP